MIETTNREYTEEDYELLSVLLPDKPCDTCDMGAACVGCPSGREYESIVAQYKAAGIYDIALKIKKADTTYKEFCEKRRQLLEIKEELEDEDFQLWAACAKACGFPID